MSTILSHVGTLGTAVLLEPTATNIYAIDYDIDLSWSILVPADLGRSCVGLVRYQKVSPVPMSPMASSVIVKVPQFPVTSYERR